MCMTRSRFSNLPTKMQVDLLRNFGVRLMELQRCTYTMVLYCFYKLYVEVIINKHTSNILCVNAFEDPSNLDPYLESIDLSPLLD